MLKWNDKTDTIRKQMQNHDKTIQATELSEIIPHILVIAACDVYVKSRVKFNKK